MAPAGARTTYLTFQLHSSGIFSLSARRGNGRGDFDGAVGGSVGAFVRAGARAGLDSSRSSRLHALRGRRRRGCSRPAE